MTSLRFDSGVCGCNTCNGLNGEATNSDDVTVNLESEFKKIDPVYLPMFTEYESSALADRFPTDKLRFLGLLPSRIGEAKPTVAQFRKSYRRFLLTWHPDKIDAMLGDLSRMTPSEHLAATRLKKIAEEIFKWANEELGRVNADKAMCERYLQFCFDWNEVALLRHKGVKAPDGKPLRFPRPSDPMYSGAQAAGESKEETASEDNSKEYRKGHCTLCPTAPFHKQDECWCKICGRLSGVCTTPACCYSYGSFQRCGCPIKYKGLQPHTEPGKRRPLRDATFGCQGMHCVQCVKDSEAGYIPHDPGYCFCHACGGSAGECKCSRCSEFNLCSCERPVFRSPNRKLRTKKTKPKDGEGMTRSFPDDWVPHIPTYAQRRWAKDDKPPPPDAKTEEPAPKPPDPPKQSEPPPAAAAPEPAEEKEDGPPRPLFPDRSTPYRDGKKVFTLDGLREPDPQPPVAPWTLDEWNAFRFSFNNPYGDGGLKGHWHYKYMARYDMWNGLHLMSKLGWRNRVRRVQRWWKSKYRAKYFTTVEVKLYYKKPWRVDSLLLGLVIGIAGGSTWFFSRLEYGLAVIAGTTAIACCILVAYDLAVGPHTEASFYGLGSDNRWGGSAMFIKVDMWASYFSLLSFTGWHRQYTVRTRPEYLMVVQSELRSGFVSMNSYHNAQNVVADIFKTRLRTMQKLSWERYKRENAMIHWACLYLTEAKTLAEADLVRHLSDDVEMSLSERHFRVRGWASLSWRSACTMLIPTPYRVFSILGLTILFMIVLFASATRGLSTQATTGVVSYHYHPNITTPMPVMNVSGSPGSTRGSLLTNLPFRPCSSQRLSDCYHQDSKTPGGTKMT